MPPAEVEIELQDLTASERAEFDAKGWLWQPGRVLFVDRSGKLRCILVTEGAEAWGPERDTAAESADSREDVQPSAGSPAGEAPDAQPSCPARAIHRRATPLLDASPRPRR